MSLKGSRVETTFVQEKINFQIIIIEVLHVYLNASLPA
jgi:hypothetical protein